MSKKKSSQNDRLMEYLNNFLHTNEDSRGDELEARFGTKRPIRKSNLTRLLQKLNHWGSKQIQCRESII